MRNKRSTLRSTLLLGLFTAMLCSPWTFATASPGDFIEAARDLNSEKKVKAKTPKKRKQYRPNVYVKHGFRMGGVVIGNMSEQDLKDSGLVVPYMFVMGYELIEHIVASDSVSVVLAQNIMIGGFEQSRIVLNANAVIGLDILDTFQFGAGINLTPGATSWSHLIAFVGWTPRVGQVFLPVTLSYVPDVYGHFRVGLTVGVSWSQV